MIYLAAVSLILSAATTSIAAPPAGESAPAAWAVDRPARVGEPAPFVAVHTASGSILAPEDFLGRTVLLTFWSLADRRHRRHMDLLANVRREFAAEPRFLMVSVHVVRGVQSDLDDWMGFLDEQGLFRLPDQTSVRFDSDPRWWQTFEANGAELSARVRQSWGVRETPRSFLIAKDGTLLAAGVPVRKLRKELARQFERARASASKTSARRCGD